MTIRYPTSETDPSGTQVETDNADLSNPVSVRLPQATDPCQADVINAPAKQLRDRMALAEESAFWKSPAVNDEGFDVEKDVTAFGTTYRCGTKCSPGATSGVTQSREYVSGTVPTNKFAASGLVPGGLMMFHGADALSALGHMAVIGISDDSTDDLGIQSAGKVKISAAGGTEVTGNLSTTGNVSGVNGTFSGNLSATGSLSGNDAAFPGGLTMLGADIEQVGDIDCNSITGDVSTSSTIKGGTKSIPAIAVMDGNGTFTCIGHTGSVTSGVSAASVASRLHTDSSKVVRIAFTTSGTVECKSFSSTTPTTLPENTALVLEFMA